MTIYTELNSISNMETNFWNEVVSCVKSRDVFDYYFRGIKVGRRVNNYTRELKSTWDIFLFPDENGDYMFHINSENHRDRRFDLIFKKWLKKNCDGFLKSA